MVVRRCCEQRRQHGAGALPATAVGKPSTEMALALEDASTPSSARSPR